MKTTIKNKLYLWVTATTTVALMLYSCMKEVIETPLADNSTVSATVNEARAFFENYIAVVPQNATTKGIYAGEITLVWEAVTLTEKDAVATLDIPIVAENTYIGIFAKDFTQTPQSAEDYYTTAVAQKLVMTKSLDNSVWSCLLISIVPDAEHASDDNTEVQKMFVLGTNNRAFNGMLLYATIENNFTCCVDRYHDGEVYLRRSLLDNSQDAATNAVEMNRVMGYAGVIQQSKVENFRTSNLSKSIANITFRICLAAAQDDDGSSDNIGSHGGGGSGIGNSSGNNGSSWSDAVGDILSGGGGGSDVWIIVQSGDGGWTAMPGTNIWLDPVVVTGTYTGNSGQSTTGMVAENFSSPSLPPISSGGYSPTISGGGGSSNSNSNSSSGSNGNSSTAVFLDYISNNPSVGTMPNPTPPTTPAILPNKKITFTAQMYKNTGGYTKNSCDCKCVADKVMRAILGNNANIGSSNNIVQLWQEVNGNLTKIGNATTVFNTLNAHINANHPIVVGVNYKPSYSGNNDNTTDHFVVIVGRGYDAAKEQYYFNYIETARWDTNSDAATSDDLRFYYNKNDGTFKDDKAYDNRRKYTITQIRPNN